MIQEPEFQKTPEEQELANKQEELNKLEAELVQNELDLSSLHTRLHAFTHKYHKIVGFRYQELDRIEKQIQEFQEFLESNKDFNPSKSIKNLYRQIAKLVHPDLTIDQNEKEYRKAIMAEVNKAYEDEDEEKLNAILREWKNRLEAIEGDDVASNLIRVIRKISQIKERLLQIDDEIMFIKESDLFKLNVKVTNASKDGRDLLGEMALELDKKIEFAQIKLKKIKDDLGL
jgi:hypothetical protein